MGPDEHHRQQKSDQTLFRFQMSQKSDQTLTWIPCRNDIRINGLARSASNSGVAATARSDWYQNSPANSFDYRL